MAEVIKPLLYSVLPSDIVVNEIFARHIYKYQSPLDEDQKESIIHLHFLFRKILMKYYERYERDRQSTMFYLDMLDNDLCLAINNGESFINVSQYLKDNPYIYKACMIQPSDDSNEIAKYIYELWCLLDNDKKKKVYEFLIHR